jgi:hypothetical protein
MRSSATSSPWSAWECLVLPADQAPWSSKISVSHDPKQQRVMVGSRPKQSASATFTNTVS